MKIYVRTTAGELKRGDIIKFYEHEFEFQVNDVAVGLWPRVWFTCVNADYTIPEMSLVFKTTHILYVWRELHESITNEATNEKTKATGETPEKISGNSGI